MARDDHVLKADIVGCYPRFVRLHRYLLILLTRTGGMAPIHMMASPLLDVVRDLVGPA